MTFPPYRVTYTVANLPLPYTTSNGYLAREHSTPVQEANPFTGSNQTQPTTAIINPQLTAMAQQAAQDLARTLVKQFNDENTTVKVNVSIAQIQPTGDTPTSVNPLDHLAVGQTMPVPMAPMSSQLTSNSTRATPNVNPFESIQVGLPPVSLTDMLTPFAGETSNRMPAQEAPQPNLILPTTQAPSSDAQF